jgi:guanyl-specific ribonuclease Sa
LALVRNFPQRSRFAAEFGANYDVVVTVGGRPEGGSTMAETVGFGKQERQMLSNDRLPGDVRVALTAFKNQLRSGKELTVFRNKEGRLPTATAGQTYYEYYVGQAHAGDARPAGKRRLVARVDTGRNILKIYFSDEHYTRGIWRELQYP